MRSHVAGEEEAMAVRDNISMPGVVMKVASDGSGERRRYAVGRGLGRLMRSAFD